MQLIRLSKNNFQAERGITRGSAQTHAMYTVFKKTWCSFRSDVSTRRQKYYIYFADNLLLFPTEINFQHWLIVDEVTAKSLTPLI